MLSTIIASLVLAPAQESLNVSDFFPMQPGLKWIYEDTIRGQRDKVIVISETLEPVDMGGKPAVPFKTSATGQPINTVYHRIEGNEVLMLGFDPEKPPEKPYAIIKLGAEKTWVTSSEVMYVDSMVPMTLTGEWKKVGSRTIHGTKAEAIEVKLEAIIEAVPGFPVRSTQTCVYAKGFGLVEMKDVTHIGEKKHELTRKLKTFAKE